MIPSYIRTLHKIVEKSNDEAKLVKVPKDKRPTQKSLERLEREICSQVEQNRAMRERSYVKTLSLKRN